MRIHRNELVMIITSLGRNKKCENCYYFSPMSRHAFLPSKIAAKRRAYVNVAVIISGPKVKNIFKYSLSKCLNSKRCFRDKKG